MVASPDASLPALPRLPHKNYLGPRTYFVTICCHDRHPFFTDIPFGKKTLQLLAESAAKQQFSLQAFCLMPDHLHFLTEGLDDQSDLAELVRLFKQRSAFQHRRSSPRQLWQNRFYEHILRRLDSPYSAACYIWLNPVRKGLCANPREYPLSGSQTIEWMSQNLSDSAWTPPWKATQAGLKSGAYTSNTEPPHA